MSQIQSPQIKNRRKIWKQLRPFVKLQFGIEKYTPEVVDFFVSVLRESSAVRIQTAWRGYIARKQYPTLQEQLKREKAAITIQSYVREWQYKRKISELFRNKKNENTEKTMEFTLEEMDKRILDWRKEHNIFSVLVPEDDEQLNREIERQMKQFYKNVAVRKGRALYVDKLLCTIDYQLSMLTDIRLLFEKDENEVAKYNAGSRKAHARALTAVQQNLHYMNAPWFRRVAYELSGEYSDVYLPSEIDACVQFTKEQEEKKEQDSKEEIKP